MRPQPKLASALARAAFGRSQFAAFKTAAAIRDTEMKVVFRILPLIAPAVAVGASVALGEPNASAFSYAGSGACLASPEGFNSKLEPNNSGVAWTTTFTSSGSADLHGNATEVGQGSIRHHLAWVHVCICPLRTRIGSAFHRISDFQMKIKSDRFHIASAGGKFVAGPNAGIAFKLSDIELGKERFEGGFAVYGSAISPSIQTVSLENGLKFQRICAISLRIGR